MKRSIWRKLFASLLRLILPAVFLVLIAIAAAAVLLVHSAATPPHAAYLVTPERLAQFTGTGRQVSDETWRNRDQTSARGWLARGAENAPAVVLLHRYGADRSWLLNLGLKINEATGFTILIPDQRGHGENPSVKWTSFGGAEAEDLSSAIEFLRGLKGENEKPLVSEKIGVYGVGMGAIAALLGTPEEKAIAALALDSVPTSSSEELKSVIKSRSAVAVNLVSQIASQGTRLYYRNAFSRENSCETARNIENRRILLLAGKDANDWQDSTNKLAGCFPKSNQVASKTNLELSGFNLVNMATSQQDDAYSRQVIQFFSESLAN